MQCHNDTTASALSELPDLADRCLRTAREGAAGRHDGTTARGACERDSERLLRAHEAGRILCDRGRP